MEILNYITEEFAKRSMGILKDNLIGVYLHGSAVMGCFNPQKSDIDFLVVIKDDMTAAAKRAFMDMVVELNSLATPKGIEMSIVKRNVCKPFLYPTPFELHFSAMHLNWYKDNPDEYIQKMNGTDKELAAHFTIIRKRGKCIVGLPIGDVFGDVPKQDYLDSIWLDIAEAEEEISVNTMYLTLNLVRVLAYLKEGTVLSKKEGGEWALKSLPNEYHPLIKNALLEYTEAEKIHYNGDYAAKYVKYMLNEINKARTEKE
jgi:predicted nucleotidyltransferase